MNMKLAAVAVVGTLSLAVLAPQANAADNGFYLGVGVTQTDQKLSVDDFDGSETFDDNAFKVIAGFRPLDWLAIEANYIDLGSIEFDDGEDSFSIDSKALTASVLLIKEFKVVDLFAKVGFAKWDQDFSVSELGSTSDDGFEPTYGVGVGAHFGSLGLRAEWERFEAESLDTINTDFDTISLSFTYTFL
jgi:outer membrane protein with beta-barrel domain